MEELKTFPTLLISLGILLLIDNFVEIGLNFIVPIIMIIIGIVKIINGFLNKEQVQNKNEKK